MKKIFLSIVTVLTLVNCSSDFKEVVDFTEVVNPNLSESSVVGKPNSAEILLRGVERQMARVLNETVILAELCSDNYVNTQTFFNQLMDGLDIRQTDVDVRDTQFQIARLRELAKFGLEKVGPNDPKYTKAIEADFHFYEGVSYLYAAMYFSYLPQEEKGKAFSAKENYEKAITSFEAANKANPKAEYYMAEARAYYYLGAKGKAVTAAQNAINLGGEFLKPVKFDAKDGPSNTMESALYQRATFDDFQPLPSLDFLDPKYSFLTTDIDPSIYVFKAEEAHLILAEAKLAESDLPGAKKHLKDLLKVIAKRKVRIVNETIEQRSQKDPDSRPNKSTIKVDGREGLVLDRTEETEVPSVSGTSLTVTEIDALTDLDKALEVLYRTRQEVFIAEGLRAVDMGIKLVICEDEIKLNDNIKDGDPGTKPTIPTFIESIKADLDAFTYDKVAGEVKIKKDINKVLVTNKTSKEVCPFH